MVTIIVAIGIFLVVKAVPALRSDSASFLTTKQFLPEATPPVFGIAVLVVGTLLTSLVAMVLAVPVALGVAVFVTQLAPAGSPGCWAVWSTCSRRSRPSSTGCGAWPTSTPTCSP